MTKKISVVALTLLLAFSLAGCGDYGYPKDWNVFVEKVNNSISTANIKD